VNCVVAYIRLLAFVNFANDKFYIVDLLVYGHYFVYFSQVGTESGCHIAVKLSVQPLSDDSNDFFLQQLPGLTYPL